MVFNKELAIIIAPHDSYMDVLQEYLKFFRENWSDCPFELIVSSNTVPCSDERVTSITTSPETQWTGRVLAAARATECRYLFVCMEDGFLSKKVDTNYVLGIIENMKRQHVVYYRNPKDDEVHVIGPDAEGFQNAYRIQKTEIYGVNNGYVIWDRDELFKVFGDGSMTAWQIEDAFNKIAVNQIQGYYEHYISDKSNFLNVIETVSHGQWVPQELDRLKKLGKTVNLGQRKIMPRTKTYSMAVYRFANRIVPRKFRTSVKRFLKKFGFKFVTEN